MTNNAQEQADTESGDVLASEQDGHTVSVIPQEDAGAAVDDEKSEDKNKESKDWRKSAAEWQDMKEKAKKGESAAEILQKLSKALGVEEGETEEKKVDPIEAVTKKVDELQTELALSKWEKSHPSVDTAEYREAWSTIVKSKGHLVKSGDLTYDDLWAIIRKGSKPSTSNRDFKEQELNLGSVPAASKSVVSGSEIDPDVHAAMKRAGLSEEQIRLSA